MRPAETKDPVKFLSEGTRWSDKIAPLAFPILLQAAMSGKTLTYQKLSEKLHDLYREPVPKSFRNYGGPPGKIGDAVNMLSKLWGEDIPPLSAVVINGTTGLPGDGAYWFISRYLGTKKISDADKPACAAAALDSIFNYAKWNKVAEFFGITVNTAFETESTWKPISLPEPETQAGGHPETEAHKLLKRWVKENPQLVKKEFGAFPRGVSEKTIQSGDRLDVFFNNPSTQLAVEVKAANVAVGEYFRGLFQCVKYRAVLRATQLAEGKLPNAQAALVVQRGLPPEVERLANVLQVVWYVV